VTLQGGPRYRVAKVRFYVDADVLGLAKILVQLRPDVTYPGDPGGVVHKRRREPCPIKSPGLGDQEWIPEVTRHGWLIITRDSNIAVNRAEIAAVRDNGARMVALAGSEAIGTWAQLEVLTAQWRHIEDLLEVPGPFIYSATRTRLRPIDLT
jgi:PIN like domain